MHAEDFLSGLTIEELRRNLLYNPDTGEWTWLISQSNFIQAGRRAGKIVGGGYRQIGFHGHWYYSARLAWFYMTGEWPGEQVDHINRDRVDDRWVNLRQASFGDNQANKKLQSNNTSGYKGVSWDKATGMWEVRVNRVYHGRYENIEDALRVRDETAAELQGEFATRNLDK